MTPKNKVTEKKDQTIEDAIVEIRECFIITPIGSIGSEIFNKTEGLIKSVLEPVLRKFNFIPIPAHHINDSGSINKQIIDKIVNCDLVIANLTGVNPNVMYELAIRHSFGKKVITMAERGTKLPFDIVDQRTLFYDDTMIGVEEIKPALEKAIHATLSGPNKDEIISNPVFDALNQIAIINNLPAEQQDGFSVLMKKLDQMQSSFLSREQKLTENYTPNPFNTNPFTRKTSISFTMFNILYTEELKEYVKADIENILSALFRPNAILQAPTFVIEQLTDRPIITFSIGTIAKEIIDDLEDKLLKISGVRGVSKRQLSGS